MCDYGVLSRVALVAPIVLALASVTNIVIVIVFYRMARKDRKWDKLALVDAYWFQEVIVSPNKDTITKCFKQITEQVRSFRKQLTGEATLSDVDQFRRSHIEEIGRINRELRNVIDDVRIVDPKLACVLQYLQEDLQDRIAEEFARIPFDEKTGSITVGLAEEVRDARSQFFRSLYQGHRKRANQKSAS